MLTIRAEQMDALNAVMLERFTEKMMEHLLDVFPDETAAMSEEELRKFVDSGTTTASGYKITAEREVALFLDLILGLGHEFEKQPDNEWMLSILENEEVGQREKMDLIYLRLQN